MKLWEKGIDTDQFISEFTVGQDRNLDMQLASYDILGTLAHIQMLAHIDLLTEGEYVSLKKALQSIYRDIEDGRFSISSEAEDIHSQIEWILTQQLGEVGKKVHSGRSRNDQVLVDLKLYFLFEIKKILALSESLFQKLIELSEKYKDVLLPGYTHMQVAMPSSFGLWFGAFAESLVDDIWMLYAAYQVANQNPLGSAAGYGSSFPLDRTMTTELLGFEEMSYNVVYAQMGRGKTEKYLSYAMAAIATTLNKLAMDVCMYSSQNFQFIQLPDELTTGSSIMPHKKNPDVFEILRGKTNQIQGVPGTISLIMTNLPSGYHREMQLLKEVLFPAIENLRYCLHMTHYAIGQIHVNSDILNNTIYQYVMSVEVVNKKVLDGKPFRTAYQEVAEEIKSGNYSSPKDIKHYHEGSLGNLCNTEIQKKMEKLIQKFDYSKILASVSNLLT